MLTRPDNIGFVAELITAFPYASKSRDSRNRLPLHLALHGKADFHHVIKPLLEANESAAFGEQCNTLDKFNKYKPLVIATYFDCDINVIYTLLRGDPASLKEISHLLV